MGSLPPRKEEEGSDHVLHHLLRPRGRGWREGVWVSQESQDSRRTGER